MREDSQKTYRTLNRYNVRCSESGDGIHILVDALPCHALILRIWTFFVNCAIMISTAPP